MSVTRVTKMVPLDIYLAGLSSTQTIPVTLGISPTPLPTATRYVFNKLNFSGIFDISKIRFTPSRKIFLETFSGRLTGRRATFLKRFTTFSANVF